MTSNNYPNTDIVREIPLCGSLGGKDIKQIPPDIIDLCLTISQVNKIKLALGGLVESSLAGRAKERQAGVDAIHLINSAIADTVQFITPHRTVADAYDDAEEEEVLPDPDMPLDIKVAKLPENDEIEPNDNLLKNIDWLEEQLDALEVHGQYATNVNYGKFAILEWVKGEEKHAEISMFLNGKEMYWQDMTRQQFLDLLNAIGAEYKEND